MSRDDRAIHSPEFQVGMSRHHDRPSCWTTVAGPKGVEVEGWPLGVKPGIRNPFDAQGKHCGQAISQEVWDVAIEHTPGCVECRRGR